MNSVRREKLRAFLEENQVATLKQIAALMPDVSLMTIHRDLSYLQEQGFITKIRGGARYIQSGGNEPVFTAREIVNRKAKQTIAHKALPYVLESGSIYLDAGTTMLALAKIIPDIHANVVTSGPNIALELCRLHNATVNLCGGILHKSNLILTGTPALDSLSKLNIDTAFLVSSGYSESAGFSCGRESESRVKALAAEKARHRIMLLDTSKLDKVFPHTFVRFEELDCIITELPPRGTARGFPSERPNPWGSSDIVRAAMEQTAGFLWGARAQMLRPFEMQPRAHYIFTQTRMSERS
ncbi:DeoR/GlpR family DNA-binding transcription regulator [Ruminococcaceae bacterium OttesenSCG-928-L11]|nr:DeoR/GlpR family DNA-binding transcription regulator [Ruminococcaceae bacterium OttesenSCG-928-L11]